jgi:hypothetical protein
MAAPTVLPDIIAYLQKETELTRHTLVTILKGSNRIGDFRIADSNDAVRSYRTEGVHLF